ncbi:hypothetical protein MRS44_010807 [Fusarium solani]|uniref:uncharacterized protein n=1 Tax=Fusarium solani TaxID=169388 RepID=UPI0032C41881|nr:hypothetical protein MRS44_010807 [Fusarium solani]
MDSSNPTDDRSSTVIIVVVICQVLSASVVALRVWTRGVIIKACGVDDYLAIPSIGTKLYPPSPPFHSLRSQLQDPRVVAIVAEEAPRPDDTTYFQPPHHDATLVSRVVVGVASWVLPEGSSRTGHFIVPGVGDPEPAPDHDLCQRRLDLFTRTKEATENKSVILPR